MNTTPAIYSLFLSMGRKKLGIIIASSIVFASAMSVIAYEFTKKTVAVSIAGEESVIKTHAETVGDLFNDLDVSIKEDDYLSHSKNTMLKNQLSIVYEPAKQVIVVDGGDETSYWTTTKTVEEFLKNQNIAISKYDQIDFSMEDSIEQNLTLKIDRAFPLVLQNGQEEKDVWSTSTTVADFLKQQGITLGKMDRVEPKLTEQIEPNGIVKIIRVEKVTDVVEAPIEFAVVTKKDDTLEKGTEKVVQEGKKGLLKKEFEVIKENGKEVDRKLLAETTVQDKQDKVVAVGTKVLVAQVSRGKSTSAGTTKQSEAPSGGKEMYVSATAYTAKCNGCSGVTATGINLNSNPNAKVIAVDPNVIPLGTKVWVEGYGHAIAGDTGGAIKGNRIDVFVPSKEQAYRFGRKKVKIRILE